MGWNEKNMAEEMLDDPAWYLVAREADGSPVAFSHFRYEMEHEEEVLYVYEIQLEEKVRLEKERKAMKAAGKSETETGRPALPPPPPPPGSSKFADDDDAPLPDVVGNPLAYLKK